MTAHLRSRLIRCTAAVVLGVVIGGIVFGAIGRTTNCGGNSDALAACSDIGATVVQARAEGTVAEPLTFSAIHRALGDDAWRLTPSMLPPDAILILDPAVPIQKAPTLIAVCKHRYHNVPQPSIWNLYSETPAHAAGYSDGSCRLLSPDEFAALDLSSFITLDSWVPQQPGASGK